MRFHGKPLSLILVIDIIYQHLHSFPSCWASSSTKHRNRHRSHYWSSYRLFKVKGRDRSHENLH